MFEAESPISRCFPKYLVFPVINKLLDRTKLVFKTSFCMLPAWRDVQYVFDLGFSMIEQKDVTEIFNDKKYTACMFMSSLPVLRAGIANQLLHSSTLNSDLDTTL